MSASCTVELSNRTILGCPRPAFNTIQHRHPNTVGRQCNGRTLAVTISTSRLGCIFQQMLDDSCSRVSVIEILRSGSLDLVCSDNAGAQRKGKLRRDQRSIALELVLYQDTTALLSPPSSEIHEAYLCSCLSTANTGNSTFMTATGTLAVADGNMSPETLSRY